ncbi:MAG: 30S ribosomal protein S4 [Candidatus Omnitrophica bacterium]|nr:30S ribosomal protein S4 [Candidatus Omnitrophota bacterium]
MARYLGPACRICRRQGMKLFLKGTKCVTEKCPFQRRGYAPGQHGQNQRQKFSDYGLQLREKQKVKRMYGLLERQFRKTFAQASRAKGVTGEKLLELLERRLDNVVYRLGFATSRVQARQIVRHGHVRVNDQCATIPSFAVRPGQSIRLAGPEKFMAALKETRELTKERPLPAWLDRHPEEPLGTVVGTPKRADVQFPIQESLIVELYSK